MIIAKVLRKVMIIAIVATLALGVVQVASAATMTATGAPRTIKLTGAELYAPKTTLTVGETMVFPSHAIPSNATGVTRTFTSSDNGVATVSSSGGLVRAVSSGTARITVKYTQGSVSKFASRDIVVVQNAAAATPARTTQAPVQAQVIKKYEQIPGNSSGHYVVVYAPDGRTILNRSIQNHIPIYNTTPTTHTTRCSLCFYVGNVSSHKWSQWFSAGSYDYRTCVVCGYRENRVLIGGSGDAFYRSGDEGPGNDEGFGGSGAGMPLSGDTHVHTWKLVDRTDYAHCMRCSICGEFKYDGSDGYERHSFNNAGVCHVCGYVRSSSTPVQSGIPVRTTAAPQVVISGSSSVQEGKTITLYANRSVRWGMSNSNIVVVRQTTNSITIMGDTIGTSTLIATDQMTGAQSTKMISVVRAPSPTGIRATATPRPTATPKPHKHVWGKWSSAGPTEHIRVCSLDMAHVERRIHTWNQSGRCTGCNYQCPHEQFDKSYKCLNCGFVCNHRSSYKVYSFREGNGNANISYDVHPVITCCSICGKELKVSTESHKWNASTGECRSCKLACNHNDYKVKYESKSYEYHLTTKTCNRCKMVSGSVEKHDFANNPDRCAYCQQASREYEERHATYLELSDTQHTKIVGSSRRNENHTFSAYIGELNTGTDFFTSGLYTKGHKRYCRYCQYESPIEAHSGGKFAYYLMGGNSHAVIYKCGKCGDLYFYATEEDHKLRTIAYKVNDWIRDSEDKNNPQIHFTYTALRKCDSCGIIFKDRGNIGTKGSPVATVVEGDRYRKFSVNSVDNPVTGSFKFVFTYDTGDIDFFHNWYSNSSLPSNGNVNSQYPDDERVINF